MNAAPDLKLVEADAPAVCGAETTRGTPCQNPPTQRGRCWIGSHQDRKPQPDLDLPKPPLHLGELGREYWCYHTERLHEAKALGLADLTVVEKASEIAELLRRCWTHVQEHGPSVKGENGFEKTNPALSKYNSLMPDYRQLTKQIDDWVRRGEKASESTREGSWTDW